MTWYANLECCICNHLAGNGGVFVRKGLVFCRPCALRLRGLIDLELKVAL